MNRRSLLLLLLLALGAAAFWLWKRDRGTTLAAPMADFAVRDTAAVSRIFIAEEDGRSVDLRRSEGGAWRVNGMPANQAAVSLLLKTFIRVEVKSPVAKSAEAFVLKTMATSAKKVEIYLGGAVPEKIWYVGHATQDHYGTFMLLEVPGKGRSSAPFIIGMTGFTGFLTTRFHANLDDWRSKAVFSYPDLSQVRELAVRNGRKPEESFTVRNTAGALGLFDGSGAAVAFDTTAVQDLMVQLKAVNFEAFERRLPRALRDSLLALPKTYEVKVTTADGGTRTVPFWSKPVYVGQKTLEFERMEGEDPDRSFAVLDDTVLVTVQRHLSSRILRDLSRLKR